MAWAEDSKAVLHEARTEGAWYLNGTDLLPACRTTFRVASASVAFMIGYITVPVTPSGIFSSKPSSSSFAIEVLVSARCGFRPQASSVCPRCPRSITRWSGGFNIMLRECRACAAICMRRTIPISTDKLARPYVLRCRNAVDERTHRCSSSYHANIRPSIFPATGRKARHLVRSEVIGSVSVQTSLQYSKLAISSCVLARVVGKPDDRPA